MSDAPEGMIKTDRVGEKSTFNLEGAPHIEFDKLGIYEGKPISFDDCPPYFGLKHGENVQRMAWVVLSYEGVEEGHVKDNFDIDTDYNRRVLWLAGYFGDIGRRAPWNEKDPKAVEESIARIRAIFDHYAYLKKDPGLLDDVVTTVKNRDNPSTTLELVLRDAYCLCSARVEPNTKAGMDYFFSHVGQNGEKLNAPFSKHPNTRYRMMEMFGWKVEKK